jgi:hypothetical protein
VPILACGPEFVEKPTAATNISNALVEAQFGIIVSGIHPPLEISLRLTNCVGVTAY